MNQAENSKWWRAMIWSLRIGVALDCLGKWWWLTQIEETPLLHWFNSPTDVGGLGWSEAASLATQQVVGWLTLLAGVFALLWPYAAVLGSVVLMQVTIVIAMWRLADGFALAADWLPATWLTLFPFATHAARIAAPLGLLLLDPWRAERPLEQRRAAWAICLLRWAIATTFIAHGIEAWQHNSNFVDLLIASVKLLLDADLSQSTAEQMLSVIGALDMLVALLCLTTRSRTVLWWMAAWGAATACSRLALYGWPAWHMVLTRSAHAAIPIAVVLYQHLLQSSAGSGQIPSDENKA